jgi:hypothetical protein
MFGNTRLAARATLAAGLAGAAMLTAGPVLASPALAAPVGAAAVRPALPGSFSTWKRAQKAAGFSLQKPTRTYGLVRTHPILVGKCMASGQASKRDVYAQWGGSHGRYFALDQNNSGRPCSNFGAARFLATYRVHGHKAKLYGFCGGSGQPGCHQRIVVLVLTWKVGSRFYVTYSRNEWRRTLVGFARHLRFV